jgi:hypothetical protein
MNILLILYLVYLSWGTAGQGRVSLLEMSRYLRCSKTQMRKTAFRLADDGLLEIVKTITDAGSEKLYLQMSTQGDDFLMLNFDAAIDTYHKHVAETILAINARAKEASHAPRKISKKERAAIEAGQKELF